MTSKEKFLKIKKGFEEENLKKQEFLKQRTVDGTISLGIQSIIEMQGSENKLKTLQKQMGELSQLVSQEEREEAGYSVFGTSRNEEGKFVKEIRNVPYSLKDEYNEKFNIMDRISLPDISEIDKFLQEHNKNF